MFSKRAGILVSKLGAEAHASAAGQENKLSSVLAAGQQGKLSTVLTTGQLTVVYHVTA